MKVTREHIVEKKQVRITFSWKKDNRRDTPTQSRTIIFDYSRATEEDIIFDASKHWVIDVQRKLRDGLPVQQTVDVSLEGTRGFHRPRTPMEAKLYLESLGFTLKDLESVK
jgi:hypothetical protein